MATQVTTKAPTGWAADATYNNYLQAQGIAGQPYTPYMGNMLAGWDGAQQQGFDAVTQGAGVGLQAQQQAQGAALNAAQYGPQMVQGGGYTPTLMQPTNTQAANAGAAALPGFFGTNAASAGQAAQSTPAQMQAASAGPANLQNVLNTNALSAGPAATMGAASMQGASMNAAQMQAARMQAASMQGASMQAASAGPAAQMGAAQMGRNEVGNTTAGSFPTANLSQYLNPYTANVVDTTLSALGRQNDLINNKTNAAAAKAGAFGGGRQAVANSENNRAFLDTAASTTANLYDKGFNNAQSAIAVDQNRALQSAQNNQQADLAVGQSNLANRQQSAYQNMLAGNNMSQFNAGNIQAANLQNSNLAQDAASRNAGFTQAANQYNAGNEQAANATNSGYIQSANQFNAGNQQAANLQNSSLAQDAASRNMAALNNMAQYNTTNAQNAESATIAAHNLASQNQAQMANEMQRYNAGLQQAANAANAGYGQESSIWNAGAANTMAQTNAGLQQRANEATSQAENTASLNQSKAFNDMAQYNATQQQTANNATALAHNDASKNQAAAVNDAGQWNSKLALTAGMANQDAGQNAINSQIDASRALNTMGLDEQKRALTAADAQFAMGSSAQTQQQALLKNQYDQWLASQNYDRNQLSYLQSALGGYSSGDATTSPYYSNTGANILAGATGTAQLAGLLPSAVSGVSSAYNWLTGGGSATGGDLPFF